MKIVLRQDHAKLGSTGDVVDVKDGFARNYLIPRNIGYEATEGNMRTLEEDKKQRSRRDDRELTTAQKLASELEKTSVTLKMKVGEDEKLFGTVTTQMIADALSEKGFSVDKRVISTGEPIRALGIYSAEIRLHPTVETKVKVWVVRE